MSNSLAVMRPELVREWSEKNLPLTPDKITYGSNKIVWWKAACGHEWQTSVKARSKGENCPICSGARVIEGINDLATLKPELAQEWSEKNEIKPTEVSVGSHKKVIWKCRLGHEWEASVKSRTVNGTGCPYCSHNKVLEGFNDLASQMPEVAAEWSEKNYPLLPAMVTPFANRKVWWKCSKGHEWYTLISTRSGGSKCPYCSGIILLKGFNDFATRQPQLAEEWSDRNLPLTPDMINEKSRKNVWWKCRECGNEWKSVVYARIKGTVCPVCADRAVLLGYNDLATTDAHLLAEWDYERNKDITPTAVSRNSMKSVWWKCSLGHSWRAKIYERTVEEKGCPVCEQEYRSVFPQLAVSYYAGKKGLQVRLNTDTEIGLPLETYIVNEGLAIEAKDLSEEKERLKSEFIMSLCEQLIGGTNLGAKQKSIIDRCTASVYRTYQQNDYKGEVPTLQDFRNELLKQDEPEAKEIALAIELFTNGSLNTFAKHTNVDTNNRLICYDILDLGKQLMPIGMLVVLDSILNRITQNRAKGRNTFIFIDEIYLLFQHEYSANFLFTLWKRVRKYGAYATGITQNVDDLLQSHTARTMLANSEFIIMLNQASTDRLKLAELLNISDLQMSYITNVEAGHGLIKVGSSLVPFANKFPKNTKLYKLMTTKPGESA